MRYLLPAVLLLSACVTTPRPMGQPGPIACVSAKSAAEAWLELDRYMRQVLEAQQTYSCGPLAPAPAALAAPGAPAVPPLR